MNRGKEMQISGINTAYNISLPAYRSKNMKVVPFDKTVSFSSRSNKRNVVKQQLQNSVPYIAALGVLLSGLFGIATRIEDKKESTVTDFNNTSIVEKHEEEEIVSALDILSNNSEIKTEYDKIIQALDTYSEQLGEDALPLIKERVALLGDGKVDVMDVLKILWIESNGRIYDDDGELLKSVSGAYGAFQITKDTADYLNYYFGLEGSENELDVKNPYKNLDACIYNLRFLHDKRSSDMENGEYLPTGDNIKTAVAWSYHDGAWATKITNYGQDYIEKYEKLSQLDEYPQVVDFILNS